MKNLFHPFRSRLILIPFYLLLFFLCRIEIGTEKHLKAVFTQFTPGHGLWSSCIIIRSLFFTLLPRSKFTIPAQSRNSFLCVLGSLYLNAHFSTILFGDFIPGVILVLFIFPAITSILSFYQKNYTEKMHKDYYWQVSPLTQKKQALSLLHFSDTFSNGV